MSSPAESSSTGRRSVDTGGVPMSASSSSSSSHPIFTWPPVTARTRESSPHAEHSADLPDPFDNTSSFAEDPFAQPSSSSSSGEDDSLASLAQPTASQPQYQHRYPMIVDGPRGSVMMVPHQLRSTTDPLLHEGQPIDAEFSLAGPAIEGYDFDTAVEDRPVPPIFSRTFSAPLPNRVGFLRHPLSPVHDSLQSHRAHPPHSSFAAFSPPSDRPSLDSQGTSSTTATSLPTPPSGRGVTPLETLSLELADSVQSAIQTLLHLSPPHLLDNAKEQYSGCTVQMPTTSLSALLTSMRSLNFLAANVVEFCVGLEQGKDEGLLASSLAKRTEDFDVGELLQNVADLLSGQASSRGVDLVLFHGDVGIKHVSVHGDGQGLGYLVEHIMRQILLVTKKGDTIELGLQLIPQSRSATPRVALPLTAADVDRHRRANVQNAARRPSSPGRTLPSPPSGHADGPLLCIIEVVHNICQAPDSAAATPKAELNPFTRLAEQREAETPKLDTLLCRRLLQHQNASLNPDAQPSSPQGSGLPRRAYELSVLLPRGKPLVEPPHLSVEEEAIRQPFSTLRLAREPTLSELSEFAESLRGKKVFLHAALTSVFARHLTSYLAAWGMDISHIPIEDRDDYVQSQQATNSSGSRHDWGYGGSIASTPATELVPNLAAMTLSPSGSSPGKSPDKFVIIDDDVSVLQRELARIRTEALPLTFKPRLAKRPTLVSRVRSTPHVRQVSGGSRVPHPVLIHFTSLANYNQVRDVVANNLGAPWATSVGAIVHPEVMVVPKPVGPRRFLTALHTAVNQPVVDPSFSPIATSPRSPGSGYLASMRTPTGSELGRDGGFFDTVAEETPEEGRPSPENALGKPRSPLGEYPPSQAHIVRTEAGLHLSLPTPSEIVATPASEYFSNATSARPGSSGASGVVMQSPDGRPFGMFFEPPVKNDRRGSYSQRQVSESARRKPSTRRTSIGVGIDEPALASPAQSPQSSRRMSGMSLATNATEDLGSSSRRGSIAVESGSLGRSSRRKTLPASNTDPLIAIGRDRSSTVTQANKKRTSGVSPVISPPIASDGTVQTALPPRVRRGTGTKTVTELEDVSVANSTTLAKLTKTKDDVVVPPINVLIVEDNPINQNILSMFLRKKKIKHQTAKDGLEAVEKWRTGGFHLILMDIQLPVMNGIDATKEIRKLEKIDNIGVFPSTPSSEITRPSTMSDAISGTSSPFRSSVIIVALTASNLQSDRVVALAAGCNDFLTKPVSLKWLERKIVEWGCMQALIDFDGWRRWKRSDPVDSSETKRGFQVGPQAAARNLAARLRIDRTKSSRSPGPAPVGPDIHVQSATPPVQATTDPVQSAAQHLEEGKEVLQEELSADIDVPPIQTLPPTNTSVPALDSIHQERERSNSASRRDPSEIDMPVAVDKPLPQIPRD